MWPGALDEGDERHHAALPVVVRARDDVNVTYLTVTTSVTVQNASETGP